VIKNNHNNADRFFPLLLTSLMAGVILLETAVPFDAAEWIGVGNLYKGVPVEVSDACCDARKIPADLQATFPSTTLPVTEFLVLQLPDILEGHQKISTQTDEWFSSELPNCDSISTLWSSSIPALSFLRELENDYLQKWMNGAISVLNPLKKSTKLCGRLESPCSIFPFMSMGTTGSCSMLTLNAMFWAMVQCQSVSATIFK
jgi:hypothetical protein